MKGFYDAQCVPSLNIKDETWRTREHSLQLQMDRTRLEQTKASFCYRVIPVWNSLSLEVVDACSINQLKNRFNRFWPGKRCKYDFHYNILDEQDIV